LESAEPATIHINKTISGGSAGVEIHVKSNKTILGVGSNGFLEGVGLHLQDVKNVIIRNLKFTMSTVTKTIVDDRQHTVIDVNGGDIITIMDSTHIWIDHNEFYNKDPAKNPNKDLYDGLVDITHKCDHITLSWNYFHDHYKCNLIGASDTDNYDRRVTLHHNHWRNVDSRVPSFRFGHGHVFNNLYEHILVSGVHTRMGACLVVEKNYFDVVDRPLYNEGGAEGGKFEIKDNFFHEIKGGEPKITSTCTYQLPYKYEVEDKAAVKESVLKYAGVGKI
jgi:pectate lyase